MVGLLIIDTDVLIDVARGGVQAISRLQALQQTYLIAISSVTEMELMSAVETRRSYMNSTSFYIFQIIKLNSQISDIGVLLLRQYRLSHGLLIPDSLIAATALTQNAAFISKNQRDYRFIEGLNLLAYS